MREGERFYLDAVENAAFQKMNEVKEDCNFRKLTGTWANAGRLHARWRPLTNGKSFVIRLLPEQRPYSAHNVVRGTNRPDRWTNLFLSDSLPAWVELQFQRRVRFNTVEITFDTEVNRRARAPLFRYPECVKKYEVAAWTGTGWKTVAEESANYQRRRVHSFDALQSDRLRIRVHQTNGAKSARIYEVRVYDEA